MKYLVYLDSRNSTGPRPSSCVFNLNQAIVNASSCRVVSFVFENTLYNVDPSNNTLVFNSGTFVIPVGYYTAQQLIDYICAATMAWTPFSGNEGGSPLNPPLVWNANSCTVDWHIGNGNILLPCSVYSIFLLDPNQTYTNDFTTSLFLGSPWALALNSPSLAGNNRFVSSVPNQPSSPFYVHHIQSGHGEIESSEPSIALQYSTPLSHANIQQLFVTITDPYSSRELTEIGAWSCLLECVAFE